MTFVLALALVAFGVALAVRRREALSLAWSPDLGTAAAVATGVLAAALSGSLLLFEEGSFVREAIHWLLIYGLCGATLPWVWTLLVERTGPRGMGLVWRRWRSAVVVNFLLGAFLAIGLAFRADLRSIGFETLARASYTLLVGGLFEVYLYYGFIHLRLERAFGPVPAILGSAALYSLWHLGTELPLHEDPLGGLTFLFVVGVFYQSVFSAARNLLAIWPFFFLGGVLTDFVDLGFPERVTHRLGWATVGWILMLGLPWWLWARVSSSRSEAEGG
ncbi:MAG: hypothetical protein R3190_04855 [Thermoanaerobaculia bacterium]|nr:hypothetical protein [Thermoanaerobaculia bacterium]